MPASSRGSERVGRGTRSGRGARGRGASSQTASSGPSNDPVPTEASSEANEISEAAAADPTATAAQESLSGRSTPTGSRSSQTPAATSRGGSRFRPKNVRRDEAERKRLEEARNRDLLSKIKAEEREQRLEERRARRGRGRGGPPRGGLIRRTVTASGPFSAIASENVKTDSGSSGWASGSGHGGRSAYRHDSENRLRYHPRREHEARINIDLLNGMTDGHAPDGAPLYQPTRYTQKSVGNLPMGMQRTLHQDPEVKVKTQAELEAEDRQSSDDEGNLFVDGPITDPRDLGMKDDNEVWHAAPKNQVKVKAEPGTEEDDADADLTNIPEAPKAPPSPEMRKKPVMDENGVATDSAADKAKRKEKKIAEDTEFMHLASDLERLLHTLSIHTPAEGEEGQEKDDQLFIFQLPPILPPLVKPSHGLDEQADATDMTPSGNQKVKNEDGVEAPRSKSSGLPAEGGYIGRLNVRKSGKVELDWGGTILNVGMATETDFLTSAMIIEQKENVETAEESAGVAFGMGQVYGRFVMAPTFDDEGEWDPDITDIMAGIGNSDDGAL